MEVKKCLTCGKVFETYRKTGKYCCYECSVKGKIKDKIINTCEYCGKKFEPKKRRKETRFCSMECKGKASTKEKINSIENRLGIDSFKDFLIQKYIVEKLSTRSIAEIIYNKPNNKTLVGDWLKYFDIELRKGSEAVELQWVNATKRRKETSKRFIKNNNIKPREKDSIAIQELRNSSEYKEWRLKVWTRDNFTCQFCGRKRSNTLMINAHHLNSFNTNKELRYDVDNGVTLCEDCHFDFHKKYGQHFLTKEMYEEYTTLKTNN